MKTYDAIVVGAGHNGLTNAAYLAKSGLDVRVLKKKKLIQDEKTRSIVQRELPAEVAQRITTALESL